jgi:pullulanase
MHTGAQIAENLRFEMSVPSGTLAYTLDGAVMKDSWKKIWVGFNGSDTPQEITLPAGVWHTGLAMDGSGGTHSGTVRLEAFTALILHL